MAVTQDGLHFYQELDGSSLLRRINLATFAPDLDTALYTMDGAPAAALSIAPLPESPDSVAVFRGDAVAVYDHGNQRPNVVANGVAPVVGALDDTGSTLYRLSVDTTLPVFDYLSITSRGVSLLPGSYSPNENLITSHLKGFVANSTGGDG